MIQSPTCSAFVSTCTSSIQIHPHHRCHSLKPSSFVSPSSPSSPSLPSVHFVSTRPAKIIIHCRGGGPPTAPAPERVLSILPYLIPLLDSLSFGKFVFTKVPILGQLLLPPLLPLYSVYRGIPFLAFGVFLVLYVFVVRNANIARFIRFNTSQALFLDIALIIPQLFQGVNLPIPPVISETCTTAVFYAALLAVTYSIVKNAQGQAPDEIPVISESVYQQLGPF